MKTWALIENNVVVNVIVWDGESEWTPPDGQALVDLTGIDPEPGPGWLYENGAFSPPPLPDV